MNFSELNIEMVFALMSGKLSAAINRKLYRSFRKLSIDITPEQWTVLYYLWSRDGVTQQELCNVTFKDKPSMTRGGWPCQRLRTDVKNRFVNHSGNFDRDKPRSVDSRSPACAYVLVSPLAVFGSVGNQ